MQQQKKSGKKPCCRRIAGNSVRSSFIPHQNISAGLQPSDD